MPQNTHQNETERQKIKSTVDISILGFWKHLVEDERGVFGGRNVWAVLGAHGAFLKRSGCSSTPWQFETSLQHNLKQKCQLRSDAHHFIQCKVGRKWKKGLLNYRYYYSSTSTVILQHTNINYEIQINTVRPNQSPKLISIE